MAERARLTLEEAETLLRESGAYGWLLGSRQVWSVSDIVRELNEAGWRVGNDAVWRWARELPHSTNFGGPTGIRATRNDLIVFFAERMHAGARNEEGAAG